MSWAARLYVGMVIATGLATLGWAGVHFPSADWPRFAFYLAVSAVASVFKIRLPGMEMTTSVGFFFYLLAAVELGAEQSILIAGACAAVQSYWRPAHKPTRVQILFSVAIIALCTAAAAGLFRWPALSQLEFLTRTGLAAILFFAMNMLFLAVVFRLVENKPLLATYQANVPWLLPYYMIAAVVVGVFHAGAVLLGWQSAMFLLPVVYFFFHSFQLYQDRIEGRRKYAEQIAAVHLRTIEALALAIEAKDETTHEHLGRVQVYALEIGKELGLSEGEMEALRAAAVLHDIGKLAVPEQIINKPGRLTPEEFEKMKIHPVVGAEILETVQFPYPVAPIVRSHHEKWDGTGYPDGLKGAGIPIGARIIGAVDCLDALASDRQYRRALPLEEAMEVLRKEAGKAFDPVIIEILGRRYVELEQRARAMSAEHAKLSIGIKVERGGAPAAGFEQTRAEVPKEARPIALESLDELTVLARVMEANAAVLRQDGILRLLASRVAELIPCDGLVIYVVEQESLRPAYVSGDDGKMFQSVRVPLGGGLSGWVAENRKSIINGNPAVEPADAETAGKLSILRSALAVPLDGSGVLSLYRRNKDAFSAAELMLLELAAQSLSGAFVKAVTMPEGDERAGAGQWSALIQRMDEAAGSCFKQGQPLSIALADLNGIEGLSEDHGAGAGERFIQAVLQRVDAPIVSQTGASGFALVFPRLAATEAREWAQRVRGAAAEVSIEAFGRDIVSLSIGISTASIGTVSDSRQLLAEAHRDMSLSNGKAASVPNLTGYR